MRTLVVLGATGSVGTSALDVVRSLGDRFRVVGLAASTSAEKLADQAKAHGVTTVAVEDDAAGARAKSLLPGATVLTGPGASLELLRRVDADVVLQAPVGAAALSTTLAAIEKGGIVALANKESLVMAGPLLLAAAKKSGATVVPVDSEHSAIFQCLRAGRADEVERIILTASGGAFRDRPLADLPHVRPDEALRHPTWTMGPRITVDSATMMNKALEIGEAVVLFDLPPERIRVVLHPQSIVHSMVEFRDGSVVAQMSKPDMRLPILFALAYPERPHYEAARFSIKDFAKLTFAEPDAARYPAIELGYRAARAGGTAGAAMNAADETAVAEFLGGRIAFPEITRRVAAALDRELAHERDCPRAGAPTLSEVLDADLRARREVAPC
jgi:1-deoxy-D-xylulose-5-phosphate reductoisomerase